jgi:hypothetical protein
VRDREGQEERWREQSSTRSDSSVGGGLGGALGGALRGVLRWTGGSVLGAQDLLERVGRRRGGVRLDVALEELHKEVFVLQPGRGDLADAADADPELHATVGDAAALEEDDVADSGVDLFDQRLPHVEDQALVAIGQDDELLHLDLSALSTRLMRERERESFSYPTWATGDDDGEGAGSPAGLIGWEFSSSSMITSWEDVINLRQIVIFTG